MVSKISIEFSYEKMVEIKKSLVEQLQSQLDDKSYKGGLWFDLEFEIDSASNFYHFDNKKMSTISACTKCLEICVNIQLPTKMLEKKFEFIYTEPFEKDGTWKDYESCKDEDEEYEEDE